MPVYRGADLTLDTSHVYRLPDGTRVISVTQLLRELGLSADFEAIAGISAEHRDRIEFARALGQAVHSDIHAFDDGAIDWTTVDPHVRPYLSAWATFRENTCLEPLVRERCVYSGALGVCGTLDGLFRRRHDLDGSRRILIDVKTGNPKDAAGHLQTAAYQLLWDAEHPDEPIVERWCVQLTPEHGVPYRVTPYTDWTDFGRVRAAVSTYFARHRRSA